MVDKFFLLLTGLLAAYLCWYFYQRYTLHKALHNLYYLMGFAVLLISGLLLRQQVEDFAAGREVGDFVPEERLSKREKDHLVACLRGVVNVRETLAADLARPAIGDR